MAGFRPGTTVVTREPFVTVDAGLPPGRYRFRLVVVDDHGNRSLPSEVVVTVVDSAGPRRPRGGTLRVGPR
ncbi:MAG: hypothetical protein Kow0092_31300 [Deferrisomatales bacterium]